jgi:hypothetical protein
MVSFHLWLDRELKRSNLTRTQFAKMAKYWISNFAPVAA